MYVVLTDAASGALMRLDRVSFHSGLLLNEGFVLLLPIFNYNRTQKCCFVFLQFLIAGGLGIGAGLSKTSCFVSIVSFVERFIKYIIKHSSLCTMR